MRHAPSTQRSRAAWVGRLLALPLLVAGLMVAAPSRAEAAATNVGFDNYNICGQACITNGRNTQGRTYNNDLIVWFAGQSPAPWLVTVNEVCSDQYADLEARMEPKGYTGFFSITRTGATSCPYYGNAFFALGPQRATSGTDDIAHYDYAYDNVNQLEGASTAEKRKLACNPMGSFGGDWVPCVTHLVPDPGFASKQAQQAYSWVGYVYAGSRRFVGGDFNLDWLNIPTGWKNEYYDVGTSTTYTHPTPTPNRKIDYIWGSRSHVYGVTRPQPYCAQTTSDHCYVSGKYSFN